MFKKKFTLLIAALLLASQVQANKENILVQETDPSHEQTPYCLTKAEDEARQAAETQQELEAEGITFRKAFEVKNERTTIDLDDLYETFVDPLKELYKFTYDEISSIAQKVNKKKVQKTLSHVFDYFENGLEYVFEKSETLLDSITDLQKAIAQKKPLKLVRKQFKKLGICACGFSVGQQLEVVNSGETSRLYKIYYFNSNNKLCSTMHKVNLKTIGFGFQAALDTSVILFENNFCPYNKMHLNAGGISVSGQLSLLGTGAGFTYSQFTHDRHDEPVGTITIYSLSYGLNCKIKSIKSGTITPIHGLKYCDHCSFGNEEDSLSEKNCQHCTNKKLKVKPDLKDEKSNLSLTIGGSKPGAICEITYTKNNHEGDDTIN